jgi:fructose transport system substrate-binding protein
MMLRIFFICLTLCLVSNAAFADINACIITKTYSNPYFVMMKEGVAAKAAELGVHLMAYSGAVEGDNEGQVAAIETCIADGAKGILIAASDTRAIVPTVQRARDAGLIVIALDEPLEPFDAADATFATDNFEAGRLIGVWAAGTLGDKSRDAKIAILNFDSSFPSFDFFRAKGFLTGFGIDGFGVNEVPATACGCNCSQDACKRSCRECLGNGSTTGIIGIESTGGQDTGGYDLGGQRAMEKILQDSQNVPDVVYVVNGASAAGAYAALRLAGKESGVLIVSIDGGCDVIRNVASGSISATSLENPSLMASSGIEAIAAFARDGTKPSPSEGKTFIDIETSLVTDKPVNGVDSIDTKTGIEKCWG